MPLKTMKMPLLAAVGIFVFLLLRPLYIVSLRRHLAATLPDVWAQLPTNGGFKLLLPGLIDTRYHDEALYAAKVQQVFLHKIPYNPYWKEEKNLGSWLQDSISFYILGGIGFLCGRDLTLTWVLAVALFGSLWFLLFHRVFRWWCGREDVAIPLALFSVLFPDLSLWLLDVNFNPAITWERYSCVFFQHLGMILPHFRRLPPPLLTSFLLCVLLLATWRLLAEKERRPWLAGLLGLGYGLMMLVHAFTYVFGLATLAVLWAALEMLDFSKENRHNAATTFCVAAMVVGAYALAVSLAVDPQARKDIMEIMGGFIRSHHFYLITIVHLLAAGFGFYQLRQESDSRRRAAWLLLASTQLAAFLCRNAQVVTGATFQALHFIALGSLTGCLMLFLWLSKRLSQKPWWSKQLGIALSSLLVLWALANEKNAAEQTYQMFGLSHDTDAALEWVKTNAPMDASMLSLSIETTEVVTIYTQAKGLVPPPGANVAGPFTKKKYFQKIAQILKTCHADVDRFLAERWLEPEARNRLGGRLHERLVLTQQTDPAAYEPAEWFPIPFIPEEKERLKELCAEVEPFAKPYYIWVNAKDAHLFRESPAAFGGKLLYENPTVQIFGF